MGAILGAAFLGWALGAHDAANVFGPAVACRALRTVVAVSVAAGCVLVGALVHGARGLGTIGELGPKTYESAVLVTLSAAVAMSALLAMRLPASSSQAVVGAIVGVAVADGTGFDAPGVGRLVVGWLLTPLGAALVSLVAYGALSRIVWRRLPTSLFLLDRLVRIGLLLAGAWASYALGANNAANVTGVFVGSGLFSTGEAAWLAGSSIALGILTLGHRTMDRIGRDLVRLEPSTALVTMLAVAVTVHAFALVGIPVSTSQAVAGGALGIGLAKGVQTIDRRTLLLVSSGWTATPLVAAGMGWLGVQILERV